MTTLLIDTSNQPLAVALVKDGNVLINYQSNIKKNHSLQLMPVIESLMDEAQTTPQSLSEIVVANGPGSYTGLRIGITTAKTMAYTLDIPLYEVSSLKALAATYNNENDLIVPLFDARRDHVFAGVYQCKDDKLETIKEDSYISIEALNQFLKSQNHPYIFIGHDVLKLQDKLEGRSLSKLPDASIMYNIKEQPVLNVHELKPRYLKLSEAEQNWKNNQTKH
ncbi:tRNA (adenosine(37)-N6)-threonylcarbamoyltransferase complex dimerization subunit type 1 TsaB [Mammaliicoccus sciuri]|uniref:tRNA (adenosine(37)-N6)-threonylcarbamoyltransferase complex dimerization subunit type 1 TsaB n=1 Tax=Mammaliicoccus sciuri TaxID=1296 RepID=UPI001E62D58A|nr:tRNA (adenosine(37)-N6)-threonylcarbamoyltransferase complex dimerization subunit type 1 TsaB [Mammaliicoccus sciuri]MCD8895262.1 tRNA (adenosine(37)-N6)-threonylcarbamoyltransferase complex dimerization subunit type 1 TsaB [Mammaliicoccus sciuri]MCD8913428.1 tRNA (adenosine(37)-N6)-threonylcarbamoyltransferase complex dimerization subunit type 1 TsaB [Mammaliicoccus sciuri]